MNIEQRIRQIAAQKISVKITRKRRSKGGFIVTFEFGSNTWLAFTARTRAEALQFLLAKVRCMPVAKFEIQPKDKK